MKKRFRQSSRRDEDSIVLSGLGLESLISNVVDHGIRFRKALDSYQTLRASSSVEQAKQRFTQLIYAAEAMVEAANRFCETMPYVLGTKERQGIRFHREPEFGSVNSSSIAKQVRQISTQIHPIRIPEVASFRHIVAIKGRDQ
jgi:hypothetical protein